MKFKETKFEKSECISLVAVDLFDLIKKKVKVKTVKVKQPHLHFYCVWVTLTRAEPNFLKSFCRFVPL